HFHTRHLEQPEQRLAEARGLLDFLVQSIPDNETPYARVIRSEAEGFQHEPDYYLVHEFLDEINQPFYFYQFAEAAAEKGLQFLAEAWHHTRLDDLPPQVQQTIRDISPDLIHIEQYLDFLRQRTFRRTLLCHDSIALSRSPAMDQLVEMSVSAMAWPLDEAAPDPASDVMRFRTTVNQVITTNHPAVKMVFMRLWELHPRSVAVRELLAEVRIALDRLAQPVPLKDEDLAGLLVQCFLSNSLMFHVHPPRFASELSDLPEASAFCRIQAGLGPAVVNQWHRLCELNELDRQVLVRLDGKHNRQRLVEEIWPLVQGGELTADMLQVAAPERLWPAGSGDLEGFVDVSLQRLLSHAFLSA
ncbi:MAG: methyltransferase regulatory domain-containing protein, partial [Pirellulaceae bacterium]